MKNMTWPNNFGKIELKILEFPYLVCFCGGSQERAFEGYQPRVADTKVIMVQLIGNYIVGGLKNKCNS